VPTLGIAAEPASPADAMAFIRVLGDLNVRFTRTFKPTLVWKDVEVATGSGFVIAPSGLLLTSRHVLSHEPVARVVEGLEAEVGVGQRRIEVAIGPGGSGAVLEGVVVAEDSDLDLAVLQVTAAGLPYLPFGDSDAAEPGGSVRVLGFPFGSQVEVGREAESGAIPQVTVTAGSLSAAREDDAGDRRYLQTDASVQPGSSGGPMLDEEGYVVGVVRMKLAREATAQGAGFSVPINLVKDFIEASGLSGQLPAERLRAGVRHTLDWKRIAIELPDGYSDRQTSRLRADAGEVAEIGFRAYRVATEWPLEVLEEAILGGREVPEFVPAPATARRRQTLGRREAVALPRGAHPALIGSAAGVDATGRSFRVEYAIVDRKDEKVVARYLGPADAVAFNLGLVRRSLESLEAEPMLVRLPALSLAGGRGGPLLETVPFPEGEGSVAAPAGWFREPAVRSACARLPPADGGLSVSHPLDYTLVMRALRWPAPGPGLVEAVRACGESAGPTGPATDHGEPAYAFRVTRLGMPIEARGVLVAREAESLLLELEAPVAKLPIVEELYASWVREVARGEAGLGVSSSTMTLVERITQDLTAAMKAQDAARTSTLRMAKAAIMNKQIDKHGDLDDGEATRLLQGLVKQREDAAEQYAKGGRPELAEKERAEIVVLKTYLPAEVTDEEIAAAVERAVAETGATSAKEMGRVMKATLAAVSASGKTADGRKVSEAVKKRLGPA
jgi:hypothetical protein